ncbi:MAG: response regulator transcription factor [Actinomycetes bacterium]
MTGVLICDDRQVVREGLSRVLSGVAGVRRIDCVDYGRLLARYSAAPGDVVLLGARRGTGGDRIEVQLTRRLVAAHPDAVVIVFGEPGDAGGIAAAIAAGARGYLRWDTSAPTPPAGPTNSAPATTGAQSHPGADAGVILTGRELQVLHGMSQGHSNAQIAAQLWLSEETVKTYSQRLFHTLSVQNRAHAVADGFRRGLVR